MPSSFILIIEYTTANIVALVGAELSKNKQVELKFSWSWRNNFTDWLVVFVSALEGNPTWKARPKFDRQRRGSVLVV